MRAARAVRLFALIKAITVIIEMNRCPFLTLSS